MAYEMFFFFKLDFALLLQASERPVGITGE